MLAGTRYDSVRKADYLEPLFSLDYAHGLSPTVEAGGRLSYSRLLVDGSSLREELGVRPSVFWQPLEAAWIELAYRFSVADYFTSPTAATLDRDNRRHSVSVVGAYAIGDMALPEALRFGDRSRLPARLRLAVSGTIIDRNGADFDFESYTIAPAAIVTLPHKVTLDLVVAHTETNFNNTNSLATAGGIFGTNFAFERDDDHTVYGIGVRRPIVAGLDVFVGFRRIVNQSNIRAFEYDQSSFRFGLAARL